MEPYIAFMAHSNYSDPSDRSSRPIWHIDLVEYLADPADKRTKLKFCEDVGIAPMTLWRYRKNNLDLINREVENLRRKYISELRNKAYKSLEQKIEKDTNALKLCFQLTGDLIERSADVTEVLSPEEKKVRIQAALDKLLNGHSEQKSESKPEPKPEQGTSSETKDSRPE